MKIIAPSVVALTLASLVGLASPAEANTQAHPYAIGHYHSVDKLWQVKVLGITRNANAIVKKHDDDYQPPKTGYQYVIVKLRVHYRRNGPTGTFQGDETLQLLGGHSHKLVHDWGQTIAPHDVRTFKDGTHKQTYTGNALFEIRKSDVAAGHLLLQDVTLTNTEKTYWFKT